SFIGEAYIMGGMIAVFLTGLFFGAMAGWWNYFASPRNSELGILIYASGFFATVITMRSFSVFTTTILPTIAAVIVASVVMKHRATVRRQIPSPAFAHKPREKNIATNITRSG